MTPKTPITVNSYAELLPYLKRFAVVVNSQSYNNEPEPVGNQLVWLDGEIACNLCFHWIHINHKPKRKPMAELLKLDPDAPNFPVTIVALYSTHNTAITSIRDAIETFLINEKAKDVSTHTRVADYIRFCTQPYTPRKVVAA